MKLKKVFNKWIKTVCSCVLTVALATAAVLAAPGQSLAVEGGQQLMPVFPSTPLLTGTPSEGSNLQKSVEINRNGTRAVVSILLYHNLCEDENDPGISMNTISKKQFEAEMQQLVDAGCHAVGFQELIDFVEKGKPLPSKPVCITFDDGYESNYKIAYPILKKHKLKSTIFVIGSTVGASKYKDTDHEIIPHFNYEQAKEMSDSGLVSIQTHTYDMHQWAEYETSEPVRNNILPLPGESNEQYRAVVEGDLDRACREIENAVGKPVNVLAYPGGNCNALSQRIVRSMGIKATVTTQQGKTTLIRGVSKTLQEMKRYYVTPSIDEEIFNRWIT